MTSSKTTDFASMTKERRAQYRENAERWVRTGNEAQKARAQAGLNELERLENAEALELRRALAAMTVPERVANAFRMIPPTETDRACIQVMLDNPGFTSSQLDTAMGWDGGWHMHFGTMAGAREHLLWPAEPVQGESRSYEGGILVDFDDYSRGITMKPEVVEGLGMIGIKPAKR